MPLSATPCSRRLASLAALLALGLGACGSEDNDSAGQELTIYAHRGHTGVVPAHPENSMSGFRAAHAEGFAVELDVKLTRDRVPVVMHDATLERTTDCRGRVDRRTARALARCRLDTVATAERVPRLAEVLAFAREEGVLLDVEIKNLPAHEDFDPTRRFAQIVVDTLEGSGIARDQIYVRSFWSRNLDVVEDAGWRTTLLTSQGDNAKAPAIAERHGFDALSPEWPVPDGVLERAGPRPVVPWTLNSKDAIAAALRAGVDGVVSDRPELVRELAERG